MAQSRRPQPDPIPTDEQLLAYAAGELPADQAPAVEAYIAREPRAAVIVSSYRAAKHALASDDSIAPPAHAVTAAKVIFRSRAAATQDKPGVLSEWITAVDRFVARLIYDSRVQPAAVRYAAAGGVDRVNLTFETDSGEEIDVQAERIPAEPAAMNEPSRWRVMGQISTPHVDCGEARAHELALLPVGAAAPIAEMTSDEHGGFALEAPAGKYELLIRKDDRAIVLTPIDLA